MSSRVPILAGYLKRCPHAGVSYACPIVRPGLSRDLILNVQFFFFLFCLMLTCGHFQEVIERLLLIAVLLELNLVNEQADGQPLKKTTTAATAGHILKARIFPGSSGAQIITFATPDSLPACRSNLRGISGSLQHSIFGYFTLIPNKDVTAMFCFYSFLVTVITATNSSTASALD